MCHPLRSHSSHAQQQRPISPTGLLPSSTQETLCHSLFLHTDSTSPVFTAQACTVDLKLLPGCATARIGSLMGQQNTRACSYHEQADMSIKWALHGHDRVDTAQLHEVHSMTPNPPRPPYRRAPATKPGYYAHSEHCGPYQCPGSRRFCCKAQCNHSSAASTEGSSRTVASS